MNLFKRLISYFLIDEIRSYKDKISSLECEVDANRSYIKVLEDRFYLSRNVTRSSKKEIVISKEKEYVPFSTGWRKCVEYLPPTNLREVLVCDGEVVSTATYDSYTQSFVKVFGAQTMRVPFPKYWQYLPAPAKPDDTLAHQSSMSLTSKRGMEICFNSQR